MCWNQKTTSCTLLRSYKWYWRKIFDCWVSFAGCQIQMLWVGGEHQCVFWLQSDFQGVFFIKIFFQVRILKFSVFTEKKIRLSGINKTSLSIVIRYRYLITCCTRWELFSTHQQGAVKLVTCSSVSNMSLYDCCFFFFLYFPPKIKNDPLKKNTENS